MSCRLLLSKPSWETLFTLLYTVGSKHQHLANTSTGKLVGSSKHGLSRQCCCHHIFADATWKSDGFSGDLCIYSELLWSCCAHYYSPQSSTSLPCCSFHNVVYYCFSFMLTALTSVEKDVNNCSSSKKTWLSWCQQSPVNVYFYVLKVGRLRCFFSFVCLYNHIYCLSTFTSSHFQELEDQQNSVLFKEATGHLKTIEWPDPGNILSTCEPTSNFWTSDWSFSMFMAISVSLGSTLVGSPIWGFLMYTSFILVRASLGKEDVRSNFKALCSNVHWLYACKREMYLFVCLLFKIPLVHFFLNVLIQLI